MDPKEFVDFLDMVRDIKGYTIALCVNYLGTTEKFESYIDMLDNVGKEEIDPVDFYYMLIELRGKLGALTTCYPETWAEIQPCVKVIDQLTRMVQWKFS